MDNTESLKEKILQADEKKDTIEKNVTERTDALGISVVVDDVKKPV